MRLARLCVLAALACAGCFSPTYSDGGLQCAPNGSCPRGFLCADNHCYLAGHAPDLSTSVASSDMGAVDMSIGADLIGAVFCSFDTNTFDSTCVFAP
jgi:hypothetical protein